MTIHFKNILQSVEGATPRIRIVSHEHLRSGFSPPFLTALEAHAYQHRRAISTGYGVKYDFTFKCGDIVASQLVVPPGPDPFHRDPQRFAREADAAVAKISWPGAMAALTLLGDVAPEICAASAMMKVQTFIQQELLPLGLGVDTVIHDPRQKGEAKLPHAHLLISCRTIEPAGFGKFIPAAKDAGRWRRWKQAWAAMVAV